MGVPFFLQPQNNQAPFAPPIPTFPGQDAGPVGIATPADGGMAQQTPGLRSLPVPQMASMGMDSGPSLPVPALPHVTTPLLAARQAANDARDGGTAIDHIHNGFLRGLARVGDGILSSVVAPALGRPGAALAEAVPGQFQHNYKVAQLDARANQIQAQNQADAQAAQLTANTRLTNDKAQDDETAAATPAQPEYETIQGPDGPLRVTKNSTEATPLTVGGIPVAPTVKAPATPLELALRDNPNLTAADWQKSQEHPLTQQEADALNGTWSPLAQKHGLPQGQFQAGMPRADATMLAGQLNNALGKQQGDTRVSVTIAGQDQRAAAAAAKNAPLDTSDPGNAAVVQGLANGSLKLQEVFGRGATTAQKAQMVAAVKALNPNFNSGDHDVENASRKYLLSGPGAQTITAARTATHHLDLLGGAVDALNNGDIRAINAIGNELGIQLGSDKQTNFNLIRDGVATELARAYSGGVPSEGEINHFRSALSADGSAKAQKSAINVAKGMLAGKVQSLQQQSQQGASGQPNFDMDSSGGIKIERDANGRITGVK